MEAAEGVEEDEVGDEEKAREDAESEAQAQSKAKPQPKAKAKAKGLKAVAKAKAKSKAQPDAKNMPRAKVEEEEVEEEEEAKAEEPNANRMPMAKAGAKEKPRQTKAQASQAVLSPVSKVRGTTSPTWQHRHLYKERMAAYPGKAGVSTEEQQNIAVEAKSKGAESFAISQQLHTKICSMCLQARLEQLI